MVVGTVLDHGDIVRDIIGGCREWDTLDFFDDALEYRSRRFQLGKGRTLDVDVVFYTGAERIRRLWSVCLTFDASWSLDYAYMRESGDVACRLVTRGGPDHGRTGSWDLLQPVLPSSMLPHIPAHVWAHISVLHTSLWKLAPLCAVLPVDECIVTH